jgi:putative chitinase
MIPRRKHYWVVRFAPVINFLRKMERFDAGKLQDFFRFYDSANQNHVDAINLLQEEIESLDPDMLADYASWVRLYRNKKSAATGLKFTPFLFEQLSGYSANKFSVEFCHDCAYLFEETGFSDSLEASRMLMGNLLHESAGFRYNKELASGEAYEGRVHDLGNTEPGDGPRFRGCGPLQVTGRAHFTRFYEWLRDEEGIDDPKILDIGTEYVADKYPFSIAINWINRNNLLKVCLEEGFDACCYRINGGFNGYQDRVDKYYICRKYMV